MEKQKIRKKQWIQKYACRMLEIWKEIQGPLGVAENYIEQIKKDLAAFYDEPLKKMLIEATY